MTLRYRVQEWLAERVTWVQYPDIRQVGTKHLFRPGFVHRMPFGQRLDLLLFSLATLVAGALLLFALLFVVYSVLFG